MFIKKMLAYVEINNKIYQYMLIALINIHKLIVACYPNHNIRFTPNSNTN